MRPASLIRNAQRGSAELQGSSTQPLSQLLNFAVATRKQLQTIYKQMSMAELQNTLLLAKLVKLGFHKFSLSVSSVQSLSRVQLFATPWTAARQAFLSHQLLELAQTHIHRVNDAIQPSHPLSSPSPAAPNPSQHQSLFQ